MSDDLSDRWKTLVEVLEERGGEERECGWCHLVKKGLWWGDVEWVCGKCMEESTIEGIIDGDRLVPRFTQECQRLMKERMESHDD